MDDANETKIVTCIKCSGSGKFHFWDGRIEECYPCEGTGKVETSSRPLPPVRGRSWTVESYTLTLRGWYRNARKGLVSYDDIVGEGRDSLGWTAAGLDAALDAVPGSREAFRALGWPV